MPPRRLRYQNTLGMMTLRARSEAIHCTKKREPKVICPRKPTAYHAATGAERLLMGHPPNFVTQHPSLEPPNAEEIADPPEEAVVHPPAREPPPPRALSHRHLRARRAP